MKPRLAPEKMRAVDANGGGPLDQELPSSGHRNAAGKMEAGHGTRPAPQLSSLKLLGVYTQLAAVFSTTSASGRGNAIPMRARARQNTWSYSTLYEVSP